MSHARRTLAAALLALAGSGLPTPADAVYRDPGGIGQALIFPYYTTRSSEGNSFNTYVSIANTTGEVKAIRVRFREGMNGREVAGFNLFLGPLDMWTGAVVPAPSATRAPRVVTADRSCVTGFQADGSASLPFFEFRNDAYSAANADGLGETIARTGEGYIEMIEMATVTGTQAAALSPNGGIAQDCNVANGTLTLGPPTGGLHGTLTLINVASGLDFTANADALAQLTRTAFYRPPTDPYPDFNAGEVDPVSHVVANGKSYAFFWANRIDAVSSALLSQRLTNEVILDSATRSGTDWVVTFPTQRFYPTAPGSGGPFSASYRPGTRTAFFELYFSSREGQSINLVDGCGFLCPPGNAIANLGLAWTANVISFRHTSASQPSAIAAVSDVLGSSNGYQVSIPTSAENGSATLNFEGSISVGPTPGLQPALANALSFLDRTSSAEAVTLHGLPAVGLALRTFRNGFIACSAGNCQGNYGGSFPHRTTVVVAPN